MKKVKYLLLGLVLLLVVGCGKKVEKEYTSSNTKEVIKSSPHIIYSEYILDPIEFTVFLYTSVFMHFAQIKQSYIPKILFFLRAYWPNSG